jgi:DHA1 family inner membrane transport protein
VPAATWVGHQIGWRAAFAGIAALGMLALLALALALPNGRPAPATDIRHELGVLGRRDVLLALATTVMGAGAMFALYTYVAPTLASVSGASTGFVTGALVLIGVGFTIGNWIGGRLADWSLDGSTALLLGLMAVASFLLPLLLPSQFGALLGLFLWSTATFAIVPSVQTRVMHAAAQAPVLASALNIGAFNLGNALGAAVGGGVLSAGLGYPAVPVAGGVLAALGLLLVLATGATRRGQARIASWGPDAADEVTR